MRRLSLSTLLIGTNIGLLLLAIAGVALICVRLLDQFADEQALARLNQASIVTQHEIDAIAENLSTSAQLLAERPTLHNLVEQNEQEPLERYLQQFQHTGQFATCAVISGTRIIAQSGPETTIPPAATLPKTEGAYFLLRSEQALPILGARAAMPGLTEHSALVAIQIDKDFAQRLGEHIRLTVEIVAPETVDSPRAYLRQQALTTGTLAAGPIAQQGSYVAVLPLKATDGTTVAFIESSLPLDIITMTLRRFIQLLLLLSAGTGAVATIVSLVLGQRLTRPLTTLTGAAQRIGQGDLRTPIPHVSGAEIGSLATTLEEMRIRLRQLTTDLRRQQDEAQAIVTGIIEGVYTVDSERRISYLNPQAAATIGVLPDAVIGRFCGDVLRPQGAGGIRPCEEHCPIVHARFRGSARATEQLLLLNGERRTVVITSAASADGLQVQVLRDETEIEATRRLRDGILANISHEFRTPLSAQLASIELLLDQLPDLSTEQIGQLVHALQRGTVRLTQLIDNLLESTRIEAGQLTLRQQMVALDEIIEDALQLTGPLLIQKDQEFIVELPYPLPPIRGDAPRLTQVFVNLLANAHKFAPRGSTIRIGGRVDPQNILLWVEDEGPGLSSAEVQTLFTRFIRSLEDEPEQSGVGLGLWLVKSIVERHGGRVEASSNQPGTRMLISLPRTT